MTLVLDGGTVVTSLDPPRVVTGDLVVEGSRVASVGGGAVPPSAARLDASGCLVIPGNVCAHHHLYSSLARGMPYRLPPPEDFVQILQRVWWRLDRALDGPGVEASVLAGGAEALLAGTTTIVDHHASPNAIEGSLDTIADALERLGVRSVLCYEVTDRDGARRAAAGVAENVRFLKGRRPLARGMVGAHASFTLSEESLAACAAAAADAGAGVHIHAAEDAADERDALARFGVRVVERLAGAGVLDDRALLAHCVHLDDVELELVHASAASPLHNPRSNMNNHVGRAPVTGLGPRTALGTDGIDGDLFAESRTAFWRMREDDRSIGPSWVLERLAASASVASRAFGEPQLGRIEPRAPADLVVLAYDPPTPVTADNLAGHWVFGLSARHVRDVVVAGEPVVRDRRLARVDAEELAVRSREQAARLWARMEGIEPHPFEPEGRR